MLSLILDVTVFSALLLLAISCGSCPTSEAFSHGFPNTASKVSRYFVIALLLFPVATIVKLRAGEKAVQRLAAKLLCYVTAFSGRPSISEILLSVLVPVLFLGYFAFRRMARRLLNRTAEAAGSPAGTAVSE